MIFKYASKIRNFPKLASFWCYFYDNFAPEPTIISKTLIKFTAKILTKN